MWEECVQALNLVYYRSHRSLVSKLEQMAVSEGRGRGGTAGPSVGPSVDIEKLTDNIYLSFLNTIERQLVIHSKFHILLNAAIVALPEPAVVGPRPKLESVKSKIEFIYSYYPSMRKDLRWLLNHYKLEDKDSACKVMLVWLASKQDQAVLEQYVDDIFIHNEDDITQYRLLNETFNRFKEDIAVDDESSDDAYDGLDEAATLTSQPQVPPPPSPLPRSRKRAASRSSSPPPQILSGRSPKRKLNELKPTALHPALFPRHDSSSED